MVEDGEDNELPAHNHLYRDDNTPFWTISAQEERFYTSMRNLPDQEVYEKVIELRKPHNRPIDLFGLRELVRKHFEEVCKMGPRLPTSTVRTPSPHTSLVERLHSVCRLSLTRLLLHSADPCHRP
jgi:hypothetical protein